MKKSNQPKNPYATLRGGRIEAPHKPKEEPRTTRTTGSDLRVKRK